MTSGNRAPFSKLRLSVLAAATIFLHFECASATTWQVGDLTTYNQSVWGAPTTNVGAQLLIANFNAVYAHSGGVIVGSTSGFTLVFTDANSVFPYQPSVGPYAALISSYSNPITTSSGAFGGDTLALEFNVDFSDAGLLPGTSGIPFGNLILTNLTGALAPLDGLTVREFLGDMNTLLSGGTSIVSIADLGLIVQDVNNSFSFGTPDQFAQDHLDAPPIVGQTPLPAALPLFATGLGAMGLFGWRRKRKAEAVA